MRVVLVNMPWAPIDTPSLALGILRNAVQQRDPDAEVEVIHAHLEFVDWIVDRYAFGVHDYNYYALGTYFSGIGDWIFSSALYDDPQWRLEEFTGVHAERMTGEEVELNRDLHRMAPEFVTELVDRILGSAPDVVGFTSIYQQNTAALAAARMIRARAPGVRTVFGGANCDGEQGAALHRNFPFVDYVVRGEGEATFPQLLDALPGGDPASLAGVPGLCWRDAAGGTVVNPMSTQPLPPGQIVAPNYDGYFDRLEESAAAAWVEPKLIVEGARGCWWGEKHHCTFCGLNGSFMQFRSKTPAVFTEEILGLVERHQVLDMIVVDNILDMGYLTSVLPALAESDYDLRLQYEIKSNLRRHQLETLAASGLVSVQPGIESLSSRVLRIMDKGVTGCQNVRVLRDSTTCGLTVLWNYLYGFPGETDEDYDPIVEQFPALHHLQPCGGANRIAIERFSPYFNRPELGFAPLRPASQYALNYALPEEELAGLAYLFDAPAQGVGREVADRLDEAIAAWQGEHLDSHLSHCDLGDQIVLVSRRAHFDWSVLRLSDPVELGAFRLLDQPHRPASLARSLGVDEARVTGLLARWRELGLVFTDAGQYIHVAPEVVNLDMMRTDPFVNGVGGLRAAGGESDPDGGAAADAAVGATAGEGAR